MPSVSTNSIIWHDRLRRFGLPLSFTKYSLSGNRLFRETGVLNLKEEEILLYRIRDLTLTMSLWQRIFGVGTINVVSSDKSTPNIQIKSIKNPKKVKELLFEQIEVCKCGRNMRTTELLDNSLDSYEPI